MARFDNEDVFAEVIKNDTLVCKDCKFVLDDSEFPCNTSRCKCFEIKPNEVLLGGKCSKYMKKN